MINELDNQIKNYIDTNPPKLDDPINQAINQVEESKQFDFEVNKRSINDNPDQYNEYYQVAKEKRLPVNFVKNNWDNFKPKQNISYPDLSQDTPNTAEFFLNKDNYARFQDDVEFFRNLELSAKNEKGFLDEQFLAGQQGLTSLSSGLATLAYAYGAIPEEEGADIISNLAKSEENLALLTPRHIQKFDELIEKQGKDLNQAYSEAVTGYRKLTDGQILDGLKETAKGSFSTVYEAVDYAKDFILNPRATAYKITQNAPNAVPSIGLGVAGSLASPIGTVAGVFTGSTITEIGSQINAELKERNVDLKDKQAVINVFRDKTFIEEVKKRAVKKGLTTASIDTLFTLVGGRFLKSTKGQGLRANIVSGAKELGVQSTGEVVSEAGGQLVREDFDFSKVDIAESLQEGIVSLGQSVGDIAIGAKLKNAVSFDNYTNLKEGIKQFSQSVKDQGAIQSLTAMADKLKESKAFNRSKEAVEEFIDQNTEGEVYFQIKDFESMMNEGESVLEVADKVLEGGRKEFLEAKESGSPLLIKKSKYVTEIASNYENAQNLVRASIDGMNAIETKDYNDKFENFVKEVSSKAQEEIQENIVQNEGFSRVKEEVAFQLSQAGINESSADIYSEAFAPFKVLAERAGLDPYELYSRYGLEIKRVGRGEGGVINQVKEATTANEFIQGELEVIAREIEQATAGKRVSTVSDKGDLQFSKEASTFPQYFRDLGFKTKKQFLNALRNPKSKNHQKIKDLAINRLSEGYENNLSGQNLPSNKFRELIGLERIEGIDEDFTLFQKDKFEIKGQLRISTDRKFSIDLFKNANKSTFLHESGHLFLEVFGDLATNENATPDLIKDYSAILKYLGVESRDQIKSKHHEKWAESFEAYLATGKAPSKGLQNAFRQFAVWIRSIYARLIERNVKLTKEVRDVMDRMFATQEEIAELRGEQLNDIKTYKKTVGMLTDSDIVQESLSKAHQEATYQAEEHLMMKKMRQLEKKQSQEYKAVEHEIKKEVEAEINESKLYSALDFIKQEGLRANTKQVKELLGDEKYKKLPKGITSPKGLDTQVFADTLNYESASELLNDILNNPDRDIAIENLTTQRMDALYPELSNLNEVREEAIEAIHNEGEAELKRKELDFLWENSPAKVKELIRKVGNKLPSPKEVKAIARKEVLSKTINNLRPYNYYLKEKMFHKEALKALTKGDFETMYKAKYNEYLNFEYYKLATEVKNKQDKFLRKVTRIFKGKKDALAKRYEMNYLNLARELLHLYAIKPITDRQGIKLGQYFKTLKEADPQGYLKVESMRDLFEEIPFQSFKDLTLSEYDEIQQSITMLIDLAREDKEVRSLTDKMSVNDLVEKSLDNISKIPKHTITDKKSFGAKFLSGIASMTRVEHLIEKLDGDTTTGILKKFIFAPLREAQTNYFEQLEVELNKINSNLKKNFKDVFKDKREIEIGNYIKGTKGKFKRSQIAMMVLHSGNESNLKKLLVGYGFAKLNEDGVLDSTEYQQFLNAMYNEGILTDNILNGIQEIWNQFESLKPKVQKAYKTVYGQYMGEIEAKPIKIGNVELQGGYAPAITDPLLVEEASKRENDLAFEQVNAKFAYSGVTRGFTKDRNENYSKPLLLDFKLIPSHLEHAVKFGNIAIASNNTHKVLKNKAFREAIFAINPDLMSDTFDAWLGRYTMQKTEAMAQTGLGKNLSSLARFLKRNAVMQAMVGNVRNAVENFTDLPAFISKIPYSELKSALGSYVADSQAMANNMFEKSKFMKQRHKNDLAIVYDQYNELTLSDSSTIQNLKDIQKFALKHGMFMQRITTNIIETVAWNGAYSDGIAKGMSESDAILHADSVVSTVGGGATALDISTIEGGNALAKMFLTFYSYFLNKGNALYYAKSRKQAYPFLVALPAILSSLLYRAFTGKVDEDEDDKYIDDAFDVAVGSQIRFMAAMIPFGGQTLRIAESQISDSKFAKMNTKLSVSPIVSQIEALRGITGVITKEELKARDVKDTMTFLGLISGVPIGSPILRNPVGYMIDVNQGEQEAETIPQVFRGFTTGRSE